MMAANLGDEIGDQGIEASSLSRAANALANQYNFKEAELIITRAMNIADSSKQPYNIFQACSQMGYILKTQKKYKEAIPFYEKAFQALKESDIYNREVGTCYEDLSECYEKTGQFEKSLSAFKVAVEIRDSIKGKANVKEATELTMNYEFGKKEQIAKDEQKRQNDLAKARQKTLIAGLMLTLILAIVAFRGFRNKRRANLLLQQQKGKLETTLSELKSTQVQLIQSEKMASLGELTAGIAHEIQNPLNFVNNFSDISTELVDEMNIELNNENIDEAKIIAADVKQNLIKINHHGKRASAIVKGMLQHSRTNSGEKEPANINALAEEYLKLSYHGFRAKDKSFNATFLMNPDNSISRIRIIPTEIGRVLLNLFNNAFYAVHDKQLQIAKNGSASEKPYDPTVSVTTQMSDNHVIITVADNGNGIPPNLIAKIFQPFFTTKPAGQGTGLGLSLSYDIIKAHGGEIKVDSKNGEGTKFIIQLPIV